MIIFIIMIGCILTSYFIYKSLNITQLIVSILISIIIYSLLFTTENKITYTTKIEPINDSIYLKAIICNDNIIYLYKNHQIYTTNIDSIIYTDSLCYFRTDSIIKSNIIKDKIIVNRTFYIPKNSLKL